MSSPERKILIIGTLGTGKTTVARELAQKTGYPYASIDDCRIHYSDSTVDGEDLAWEHFLRVCSEPKPGILEFSGVGPHVDEVRDALLSSGIPVFVIWLDFPLDTCIERARGRQKIVPYPFPFGPIDYSVPAIYSGIEYTWNAVWSAEPQFHVEWMKFESTISCSDVYAAIVNLLHFFPDR